MLKNIIKEKRSVDGYFWKYEIPLIFLKIAEPTDLSKMKQIEIDGETETGYYVSKNGEIYSTKTNRFLKTFTNNGYKQVSLRGNDKYHKFAVHRIVAQTYIPNENNYPIVNHLNGDKFCNEVGNLEWCTYKENSQHSVDTGLTKIKKGVVQYSLEDEYINEYDSIRAASLATKTNHTCISAVCKNKRLTAGGYKWKYK